ncbi:MAG: mechanosensitive ion channel family protein [Candidatus Omnitrophica bacterium]|nr:mechanosensitive ion channel family protein [Candidatus Omnitrophota bacterium]
MIGAIAVFLDKNSVQFFLFAVAIYLTGSLIVKIINRQTWDLRRRHTARKITLYSSGLLIIVFGIIFWLESIKSVAVVISIMGAGLVVALQDVIMCFAGWVLIMLKHPFTVGDRIEIGTIKGDVIDVRMFQTALLEVGNWVDADQSTGRVVHIPNSSVFKEKVYNYTEGFRCIWNEIKIVVTFESNWKKAQEIILRHANPEMDKMTEKVQYSIRRMAEQYMIHYEKLTPIVYVKIADNGVALTLRYLTEVKERRTTEDRISKNVLDDFAAERDINFAYPTYRLVR